MKRKQPPTTPVEDCLDCPFKYWERDVENPVCTFLESEPVELDVWLRDKNSSVTIPIPDECPLPDAL